MTSDPCPLSPDSCAAARLLLNLSQAELAELAEISVSTLRRFEAGDPGVRSYARNQIWSALEREGISFVGAGYAPKLKQRVASD